MAVDIQESILEGNYGYQYGGESAVEWAVDHLIAEGIIQEKKHG